MDGIGAMSAVPAEENTEDMEVDSGGEEEECGINTLPGQSNKEAADGEAAISEQEPPVEYSAFPPPDGVYSKAKLSFNSDDAIYRYYDYDEVHKAVFAEEVSSGNWYLRDVQGHFHYFDWTQHMVPPPPKNEGSDSIAGDKAVPPVMYCKMSATIPLKFDSYGNPMYRFNWKGQSLIPRTRNGYPLFPCGPEDVPLFPRGPYGEHEFLYTDDGRPVFPTNLMGRAIVPYDSHNQPIFPMDDSGEFIWPRDHNDHPYPPMDIYGTPTVRYDQNGYPILPYDEKGEQQVMFDMNGLPMQTLEFFKQFTKEQTDSWGGGYLPPHLVMPGYDATGVQHHHGEPVSHELPAELPPIPIDQQAEMRQHANQLSEKRKLEEEIERRRQEKEDEEKRREEERRKAVDRERVEQQKKDEEERKKRLASQLKFLKKKETAEEPRAESPITAAKLRAEADAKRQKRELEVQKEKEQQKAEERRYREDEEGSDTAKRSSRRERSESRSRSGSSDTFEGLNGSPQREPARRGSRDDLRRRRRRHDSDRERRNRSDSYESRNKDGYDSGRNSSPSRRRHVRVYVGGERKHSRERSEDEEEYKKSRDLEEKKKESRRDEHDSRKRDKSQDINDGESEVKRRDANERSDSDVEIIENERSRASEDEEDVSRRSGSEGERRKKKSKKAKKEKKRKSKKRKHKERQHSESRSRSRSRSASRPTPKKTRMEGIDLREVENSPSVANKSMVSTDRESSQQNTEESEITFARAAVKEKVNVEAIFDSKVTPTDVAVMEELPIEVEPAKDKKGCWEEIVPPAIIHPPTPVANDAPLLKQSFQITSRTSSAGARVQEPTGVALAHKVTTQAVADDDEENQCRQRLIEKMREKKRVPIEETSPGDKEANATPVRESAVTALMSPIKVPEWLPDSEKAAFIELQKKEREAREPKPAVVKKHSVEEEESVLAQTEKKEVQTESVQLLNDMNEKYLNEMYRILEEVRSERRFIQKERRKCKKLLSSARALVEHDSSSASGGEEHDFDESDVLVVPAERKTRERPSVLDRSSGLSGAPAAQLLEELRERLPHSGDVVKMLDKVREMVGEERIRDTGDSGVQARSGSDIMRRIHLNPERLARGRLSGRFE